MQKQTPPEQSLPLPKPAISIAAALCGSYHAIMLTTLDAIVDRIVTGCAPERIIVFGS